MSEFPKYRLAGLVWIAILLELLFYGLGIWLYYLVKHANSEFRLENPEWLYALAVLPVFSLLYFLNYRWKNKAIQRFADNRLLQYIMPYPNNIKVRLRYLLLRLGLGLMLFSLCNPQFGKSRKTGLAQGIDIIIALDISKSMEARDLSKLHSRLDIAKRSISRLLKEGMTSDRVGLVIFAGNAYKQVALSQDYDALMFDLGNVNTNMLSVQGTNIAAAIDLSLTSFNFEDKTNKAIIVVSDGENHEPNALVSAKKAFKENNVKIYSIGMGTPQGARIPKFDTQGQQFGYMKDNRGNTVLTKLNEKMLQDLADAGNGIYIKATNTSLGLEEIIEDIDKIQKTDFGKKKYKDYDDQFQWFLGPGLLLFVLSLLVHNDQRKNSEKHNLFA